MRIFLWCVTVIGAGLGFVVLGLTVAGEFTGQTKGATQEISGAALAAALAVVPYVFARAFDELGGETRDVRVVRAPKWSAEYDRERGAEAPSRW